MKKSKIKVRTVLTLALGALSFMMLSAPLWWVGFAGAVAALVFGIPGLRSEEKKNKYLCAAGLLAAVAAAAAYVIMMIASGFTPVSIF